MAIGFGATDGVGSTDRLDTGLTGFPAQRTWAFRCKFNSSGGGTFGRIFSAGSSNQLSISYLSGFNSLVFTRQWDATTYNWGVGAANTIGTTYSVVISYNQALTTNNPVAYVNGASFVLVNNTARVGSPTSTSTETHKIGNRGDNARNWDGWISSFAIWDDIIPADMALAISGSYSPLIYTKNLVYYNPMVVTNSVDIIGAKTQTLVGGKTVSHPPVLFELGGIRI